MFCVRLSDSVFCFGSQDLFCYVFDFKGQSFSFASSLIERVIKNVFSALTNVCAELNICLNLCGWQIYWILFFIDVMITLLFVIHNSMQLSLRGSVMELLVHVHVLVNAQ